MRKLFWCLLVISSGHASETVFSIHDDVLAYPQYEIVFSETYISDLEAAQKLSKAGESHLQGEPQSELFDHISIKNEGDYNPKEDSVTGYEKLVLNGRPFLCSLPKTSDVSMDEEPESTTKIDHEKDLVTAADRGWELLQELEGKCMFFPSGWWSYSFCYNFQIKQFHQLPPGSGGPIYPPQEDPSTPSYVLGRFGDKKRDHRDSGTKSSVTTELQTKGETRYLVQKIGGGTTCDLTGKDRRIEVQFHCNPQSTDRIGWIKEVATCTYLMIVYTPRLCSDVAFLPPRQNEAHTIACREILRPTEIAEWIQRQSAEASVNLIDQRLEAPLMAGDIEIGAMKEVGRNGRRIEKGKVVSAPEEKVEMVAMQKNGKLQKLSKDELKKLDLNPETVEAFRKEIQGLAGEKDWKVEKIDDDRGVTQLRGVVADDNEEQKSGNGAENEHEQGEEGSEEAYKEEI